MSAPDRVIARPTSLPDGLRGHGVVVTFYGPGGYDGHVFLDRDAASVLREQIDAALEAAEVRHAA